MAYQQAFLTLMSETHRLELLQYCDLSQRNISALSWAPEWSKERTGQMLADWQFLVEFPALMRNTLSQISFDASGVVCATIHTAKGERPL